MWWDSLTNLQQVAFIIATAATAIMVILIIMMLIGMDGGEAFDGDVGMDFDMDGDVDVDDMSGIDAFNHDSFFSIGGLKIVTIRGVLAFFSIGGWMVYALADTMNIWGAILIGVAAGAIASILLAYAMKAIFRLESSGNLDFRSAIGKTAVVYIRVPKNNSGRGKVMLTHQGRLLEVDAITKGSEDIIAKHEVKIVGLENETTLVVSILEEEK
ncbi:MAG: hypothetical protein JXB08_03745 [Bacilli bacterium]|nr:hypothetical protein [Bacilli bacterium]MBN2876290.1 hypothetical protein [Bacilli bacterium]